MKNSTLIIIFLLLVIIGMFTLEYTGILQKSSTGTESEIQDLRDENNKLRDSIEQLENTITSENATVQNSELELAMKSKEVFDNVPVYIKGLNNTGVSEYPYLIDIDIFAWNPNWNLDVAMDNNNNEPRYVNQNNKIRTVAVSTDTLTYTGECKLSITPQVRDLPGIIDVIFYEIEQGIEDSNWRMSISNGVVDKISYDCVG